MVTTIEVEGRLFDTSEQE